MSLQTKSKFIISNEQFKYFKKVTQVHAIGNDYLQMIFNIINMKKINLMTILNLN